ncbi:uncharacterized protein LOC128988665 [Macrosteles quadrilineatus]|uniref:uncharacterized protein LOC128988665 n=1 Tax=Macrosteles quadrilineatus TaxID=74068 RepID=UPI0023E1FE07|nr:uncharacterized protein LOC128988665 [Macrosteles quadrilineatus]
MSSLQKPRGYLSYSPSTQRTQGHFSGSLSGSETDISTSNENLSHEERYVIQHTTRQEPQGQENRSSQDYNTLIIHGQGEDKLWNSNRLSSDPSHLPYKAVVTSSKESLRHPYCPSVREITDIPDDYLNQSQVLKHLAKEVKVGPVEGESDEGVRPPPQYPWSRGLQVKRLPISKSQPDLSHLGSHGESNDTTTFRHTLGNTRKENKYVQNMLEILLHENNSLKIELESCYQKVAKSQKLEHEVGKVHRAHEDLVASCERRERLERAARQRLQGELQRMQEASEQQRQQMEMLTAQLLTARASSPDHSRKEMSKREALIAQLVTQNKELAAVKERQEIELAAQRATLQEQRTHIDILDTALTNAQSNVVRLEEECRKKQVHVERVAQLQRALQALQLASDRREQTERKLRLQLENELRNERARNNSSQDTLNQGEPVESVPELKRRLREKDEKIMRLEGEVAKWEQRYLEESELRQAAIDAASIPKDAKIAALEKTSQESEKLIAEARSDKLRQMDEVHAAQKKVTDLEAKMKELESKLAEKDAMIRVLQKKHTYDKEVSSSYPSISLSHHTPQTSLNPLNSQDLGQVSTTSVFSTASSGYSYSGSVDSSYHKYSPHKSLDDQLKELDSQLLSKRGLCCFPGFSHPGTSSRKGKIPQPLLASVGGFEAGGFLQGLVSSSGQAGNEMVLLEKQGLCSQQQRGQGERCGSLPPSSLPRPKRHHKAANTKERRLGEYGRLSDGEGSSSRKASANSSTDAADKTRSSPSRPVIPLPTRKLGEYGRLSDGDRKTSASNSNEDVTTDKPRESPMRNIPLPPRKLGEYGRLSSDSGRKTPTDLASSGTPDNLSLNPRSSPVRKFSEYSRYEVTSKPAENKSILEFNGRKLSSEKTRESPSRSLIPTPRKLSDFGCFESPPPSPQSKESKLRLIGPGTLRTRRGSLSQPPSPKAPSEPGVRSLPTPNKYRIQF